MSINKKTMNIILIIVGVVLVGWFLYSWLPVRNIEEPKYAVVSNDKRVELREVPARKVAVRRFSWTTSESAFKKHEIELLEALRRDDIETVGAVNVARYNMPWTIPFMLRGEVQIEVNRVT